MTVESKIIFRSDASEVKKSVATLKAARVELDKLPGKMQTAAGRALAEQRLAVLTDFRAAFADEWGISA